MEYPFQTVDVFTATRFGGNPLAVVTDARGLSDPQMQQIAAEFHYSETTFVLPPTRPDTTARVRIFTPTAEVPFAGHPNVGTAFVLAQQGSAFGQPVGAEMRFEEAAGLVAVRVEREGAVVRGAAITAPQPLSIGPELPAEVVAACASLDPQEIALTTHPPRLVSVGLSFVVAELVSREALARARPNLQQFAEANQAHPHGEAGLSLFLYVSLDTRGSNLAARMFAPLDDVPEDPATGSASAALAAYRVALAPVADEEATLIIHQGEDMGRPSRIEVAVRKAAGQVEEVVVRGACVPVMRGVLTL
jgi:trans-2,3-dihydro-3-hydroxyanthranilate isomerase